MSSSGIRRSAESRTIRLSFAPAEPCDAVALAELRTYTASALTARFGEGHWSGESTERGVLAGMHESRVWLAHRGSSIVATFRLATKKPWAIERSYFARSKHPLYLTDMAVHPDLQRCGVGRRCLEHAVTQARAWPADAIRLDAYDADAGAGPFYAKCGFTEVGRVIYRDVPLVYYELLLSPTNA
jgi:GNAT superfamily N-acetyltransferase